MMLATWCIVIKLPKVIISDNIYVMSDILNGSCELNTFISAMRVISSTSSVDIIYCYIYIIGNFILIYMYTCVCVGMLMICGGGVVYVRVSFHVCASMAEWLRTWICNQKVPGLLYSQGGLCLLYNFWGLKGKLQVYPRDVMDWCLRQVSFTIALERPKLCEQN